MGWRSAVVLGGLAGLIAAGLTAAWLASIEIDDGLEALIVVPLLVALMAGVGSYGAFRRAGAGWVVGAAGGSIIPIVVVLLWSIAVSLGEDPTDGESASRRALLRVAASVSAAGFVFALACVGGLCGWALVELGRLVSVRRRRRAGVLG